MSAAIVTPGPYGTSDFTRWFKGRVESGFDVYLPEGTHTLTEQVRPTKPGWQLSGAGANETILQWGGLVATNYPMLSLTRNAAGTESAIRLEIGDLTLKGTGKAGGNIGLGLGMIPAGANGTIVYSGRVHHTLFDLWGTAVRAGADNPAASEIKFEECGFNNSTKAFEAYSFNSLNFKFVLCAFGQNDWCIYNVAGGTYTIDGGSASQCGYFNSTSDFGAFLFAQNVPGSVTITGFRMEDSPSGCVYHHAAPSTTGTVLNLIGVESIGNGTNPAATRFAVVGNPGLNANLIGCLFTDCGAARWAGSGGYLGLAGSNVNATSGVLSVTSGTGPRRNYVGSNTVNSSNIIQATVANVLD